MTKLKNGPCFHGQVGLGPAQTPDSHLPQGLQALLHGQLHPAQKGW